MKHTGTVAVVLVDTTVAVKGRASRSSVDAWQSYYKLQYNSKVG